MSTETKYYQTAAFRAAQKKAYQELADEGFYDIESGLDSPPLLKPHHRPLNAAAAAAGRLYQSEDAGAQGSEWEQVLSTDDRWVDSANSDRGLYGHYAQLIAAQEYNLQRLGLFRRASEIRASWALHAQGMSEREIARNLGVYRSQVEQHLDYFSGVIRETVATLSDPC